MKRNYFYTAAGRAHLRAFWRDLSIMMFGRKIKIVTSSESTGSGG